MVLAESTASGILVVAHVVTVVLGLALVATAVLRGRAARADGSALAAAEHRFRLVRIGGWLVIATLVLGVVNVLTADDVSFGQTWVWLSIVLGLAMVGAVHGMVMGPCRKVVAALRADGTGAGDGDGARGVADLAALGRRMAIGCAVAGGIAVAILVLMVTRPGG